MRTFALLLILVASLASFSNAFAPTIGRQIGNSRVISGPSSMMVPQQLSSPANRRSSSNNKRSVLFMGNVANFGVFSPAVYVAKIVLGKEKLNKIRGKAISLHSQYIGDFCEWVGAYHLRTRLIKKAKLNGDVLGFLV